MFQKMKGDWTDGYIATLSSEQTPGRTALESGINNGQWYNSVYDKLHNIAVTSSIT
jgi:hypothetical protein